MAEQRTIARPYAQAVFELAQEQKNLKGWSTALETLSNVASNEDMRSLMGNPRLTREQLADTVIDLCGSTLFESSKNFVRLVVENDRLEIMPAIREVFEQLRAVAESTLTAEVVSAFPINKEQEKSISKALQQRFKREIALTTRVDENLVGGVVVRAGDYVIDGSVVGQLDQLRNALAV